jgi:hypothetical protein
VLMDEPEEAHVSIVGYGGERGGRKGRGGGRGYQVTLSRRKGGGYHFFQLGREKFLPCKTISSTKKKYDFFHARISRSGKGRVSDFSATRVRVEGVGSPRVAEKVTHEAPTSSGIREVEKILFFW